MSTAGEKCRFLITARPYAWEETEQRIAHVEQVYRLADFDFDQIDQFITRWYEALLALGWVEDARLATPRRANCRPLCGGLICKPWRPIPCC